MNEEQVSVPLRGKGRDQQAQWSAKQLNAVEFPSPCGEKVGINPTLGKA